MTDKEISRHLDRMTPAQDKLEGLVATCVTTIAKNLRKVPAKHFMPALMVMGLSPDMRIGKTTVWIMTPFDNDADRHATLMACGFQFISTGEAPLAVVLCAEDVLPGETTFMEEVVLVLALAHDDSARAASWLKVSRDDEGFIVPGEPGPVVKNRGEDLLTSFFVGFAAAARSLTPPDPTVN